MRQRYQSDGTSEKMGRKKHILFLATLWSIAIDPSSTIFLRSSNICVYASSLYTGILQFPYIYIYRAGRFLWALRVKLEKNRRGNLSYLWWCYVLLSIREAQHPLKDEPLESRFMVSPFCHFSISLLPRNGETRGKARQ